MWEPFLIWRGVLFIQKTLIIKKGTFCTNHNNNNPLQEQKGQVLVEFALVAPLLIFFIFYLLMLGLWIYNSSQADQAARIAAGQCARTGNSYEAKQEAIDYLKKTIVLSEIKNIEVKNNGATASSTVAIEMETFLPGLKKLLDHNGGGWTGKVTIKKEARTVSEYRFRHQEEFN